MTRQTTSAATAIVLTLAAGACTPTVKIVAPDKPIEINLNVKIDQEVRVILDQEVEELITNNPDLF
ncbi:MAG: YnbE family lipoprotein [Alphaproteobacteria bacterium]|nr:YnbE family lipoprotein [Alphaproteobacteria bacterium]